MAQPREERNPHADNARAWADAVKKHPSLPDPNAQITAENAAAIRNGFEQALTRMMTDKIPEAADAEMQQILRAKMDAVLGSEQDPRTNAQVKEGLRQAREGTRDPKNMEGASEAVTCKDYRPLASVAFMVSFGGAVNAYNEKIEGKTSHSL